MVSTNCSKIMRRKKLFIAALAAMLLAIPAMVQSKKGEAAKKAVIEREQSEACFDSAEREQAYFDAHQGGREAQGHGNKRKGSPKIQEELTETHYIR